MSRRRHFHRVSLPRAPRVNRRAKAIQPGSQKRAIKRAAMRDCGRRCVYCAALLEYDFATLDHVHPLSHGGSTRRGTSSSPVGSAIASRAISADGILRAVSVGGSELHRLRPRGASRVQAVRAQSSQSRLRSRRVASSQDSQRLHGLAGLARTRRTRRTRFTGDERADVLRATWQYCRYSLAVLPPARARDAGPSVPQGGRATGGLTSALP